MCVCVFLFGSKLVLVSAFRRCPHMVCCGARRTAECCFSVHGHAWPVAVGRHRRERGVPWGRNDRRSPPPESGVRGMWGNSTKRKWDRMRFGAAVHRSPVMAARSSFPSEEAMKCAACMQHVLIINIEFARIVCVTYIKYDVCLYPTL